MFFELRFQQVSFQYLANHFRIAEAIAKDYQKFQLSPTVVRFDVGEDTVLELNSTHIGLALAYEAATPDKCVEIVTRVAHEWKAAAGAIPPIGRAGFRVRGFQSTEMSFRELVDVYGDAILAAGFRSALQPNYDFALTVEELDGVDGSRLLLGIMGYDELLAKWQLDGDRVEAAPSFLTVDFDYGSSKISGSASDLEKFVRSSWSSIHDRNRDLAKVAGL